MDATLLIGALALFTLTAVLFWGFFDFRRGRKAQKRGDSAHISNYSQARAEEKQGKREPIKR